MSALLEIRDLNAHYGSIHALQGVDLDVEPRQVVAVLGRNGAGKSTLIHTVMGMLRPTSGSVRFDGRDIAGSAAHAVSRAGIALVPQGRRIFAPLTVEENLRLAQRGEGDGAWTLERVYDLLPVLAERRRHRGTQLSGGEQQMLAIGRALLSNPRLVLLDEPSEGLAPKIVSAMRELLAELTSHGLAALLVEQNLSLALALAERVHIMDKGRIAYSAATDEFRRNPQVSRELLGVR